VTPMEKTLIIMGLMWILTSAFCFVVIACAVPGWLRCVVTRKWS
jgi:hypothetical protein